jgi:molecular chaperone DnaK
MSERPVLGIDLGTTYTCVAHLDDTERVSVLPNSEGDLTTPSVVYFEDTGTVTVGKFAKKELDLRPDRVVELIKRHMGEEGYTVRIGEQELYPQAISALILRSVVQDALSDLGRPIPDEGVLADAVITVPAYFGAAERQATIDAGRMAGLNVLTIINEPTAAAIAHGLLGTGEERVVLVYDLGGGTFDVTIIKVSAEQIRVVATGGDHRLGGADWDERIQDLLAEDFAAQYPQVGDPREDLDTSSHLGLLSEEAKMALTRRDSYTVTVSARGERARIDVSRHAVIERTADLVGRTLEHTRHVLEQARAKGVTRVDELLLVGGMSRSPAIAQRLAEEFPELPEPRLTDPDQIVAKGAALFAAHSVAELDDDAGPRPTGGHGLPARAVPAIINVTSKGYGVKVVDSPQDGVGHIEWLVRPNDELPASPRGTFRTISHDQQEVNVRVYESSTDVLTGVLAEHLLLVEGQLVGLPPGQPAGQPIEIAYTLGDDAILRIRASSQQRELSLEARISGATPQDVMNAPLPDIQR